MNRALINIDVNDLTLAEDFYTQAFDLRVGRRFGDDGIELLGFEAPIYLLLTQEGTLPFEGATQGRTFKRHWTPVHLDIAVDDIEMALQQAIKAGAKVEGEIAQRSWGKIVLLSDPCGNGLCILQFTGPGYDAIANT